MTSLLLALLLVSTRDTVEINQLEFGLNNTWMIWREKTKVDLPFKLPRKNKSADSSIAPSVNRTSLSSRPLRYIDYLTSVEVRLNCSSTTREVDAYCEKG